MKEQFVTYEIALSLKELGFNEDVTGYYLGKELRMLAGFQKLTGWGIPAPLWQQAIDFLREEHNINIAIDYLILSEKWIAEIYYINNEMKGESTPALKTYFETREEAIERAIEKIENKKK